MPVDGVAGNVAWSHEKGLPPMAGGLGAMHWACVQPYWALRL